MDSTIKYIRSLLSQQGVAIPIGLEDLFNTFSSSEEIQKDVNTILLLQQKMTKGWQIVARREEINRQLIAFPNGTAGKLYTTTFDFETYRISDITSYSLTGFDGTGLEFDAQRKIIHGVPIQKGDIILEFSYNFAAEPGDAPLNKKRLTIIINPDPKSLWKDIPSNSEDPYWKQDNVAECTQFLDKTMLAVSKRGRSHANKGNFRDDHYSFKELGSGWGVVAISDGAGSAANSRHGSLLACNAVTDYLEEIFSSETTLIDQAVSAYPNDPSITEKLNDIAFPLLTAAAKHAHSQIEQFAAEIDANINDFHATLAFALIKKFPAGYAFLSYGVGDCPMVVIEDLSKKVTPLNRLDVGEYGGGTRFVTMSEIFKERDDDRCNFVFVNSFSHFVMMSDGIFDPKFEVEANLAKTDNWISFFKDLSGGNNEDIEVEFENSEGAAASLSRWTDFWSPGNHDDRTLILLF